jgi:hypothetical protein
VKNLLARFELSRYDLYRQISTSLKGPDDESDYEKDCCVGIDWDHLSNGQHPDSGELDRRNRDRRRSWVATEGVFNRDGAQRYFGFVDTFGESKEQDGRIGSKVSGLRQKADWESELLR